MRFIYLDAGLRYELGHHANYARSILRELRAKNINAVVVASAVVVPELQSELGAMPLFRAYARRPIDSDPIVGWLKTFETCSQLTFEDLRRLEGIAPDDIVYMGSMYEDLFMGLVRWAGAIEPARLPTILADFSFGPGLEVSVDADHKVHYSLGDLRADPRPLLHRYAARAITPAVASRLTLATYDRPTSAAYAALGLRMQTWPAPIQATTNRRRRAGGRPITVAILGHQRPDKGYYLMPEVVSTLLRQRSDIKVLVHNGAPDFVPEPQQALRQLALEDQRVVLDETIAGPEPWARLLERSDLILCPYHPTAFVTRFSSLACEAIANAIPLVVPARTSLAELVKDFGEPGTIFERFEPAPIIDAVNRALDDFDRYAEIAQAAAERWRQTQGARALVDQLLALARGGAAALTPAG
ncbi:MAG TPA: glycosyltransferase [Stellaceae bacterium]|nr:glycosyltransferase [Stellaceae bacterium]